MSLFFRLSLPRNFITGKRIGLATIVKPTPEAIKGNHSGDVARMIPTTDAVDIYESSLDNVGLLFVLDSVQSVSISKISNDTFW